MATHKVAESPHTPLESWPWESFKSRKTLVRDRLGNIMQSVYGASAIADLLRQDTLIAECRDADNPEEEEQPFPVRVRSGLEHALAACLRDAFANMEKMQDFERNH